MRDKNGHATGNLKIDDFVLSDNGKPQFLTKFSVEKAGGKAPAAVAVQAADPTEPSSKAPPILPDRFIIYLFDDVHADFATLVQVRDAAINHLDANMQETDRAAIFTTSGQGIEDFTNNHAVLKMALMALRPRPIGRPAMQQCPDMTFYLADIIQNQNNPSALEMSIDQTIVCANLINLPNPRPTAESMVRGATGQLLASGEHESRVAMSVVKDALRRLSGVAGQRMLVIASPGFYTTSSLHSDKSDLIERAIKANVVINTLDARGLYTDASFDASRQTTLGTTIATGAQYSQFLREEASANADILAELAYGTGGTFSQNTNDFKAAFTKLAAAPEYIYMLGFSPQNLKIDGRYHKLKVALKNGKELTLQARRGYFAPKEQKNPEETAKSEIEEALFSREEMRDIPVTLHTQFFKRDEANARLSVINRIDLRPLHFRKADNRNYDDLVVVTAVFDSNGRFVNANKQSVTMRLLDDTVAKKLAAPLSVRTSFDLQPGIYAVRVVVRDTEGQLMSAANGAVEIP